MPRVVVKKKGQSSITRHLGVEASASIVTAASLQVARTRVYFAQKVASYTIALAVAKKCSAELSDVLDNTHHYVRADKLEALHQKVVHTLSKPGVLPIDKLRYGNPDHQWYLEAYGQEVGRKLLASTARRHNATRDILHRKSDHSMFGTAFAGMAYSLVSINKSVLPSSPKVRRDWFDRILGRAVMRGVKAARERVRGGGPHENVVAQVAVDRSRAALAAACVGPKRSGVLEALAEGGKVHRRTVVHLASDDPHSTSKVSFGSARPPTHRDAPLALRLSRAADSNTRRLEETGRQVRAAARSLGGGGDEVVGALLTRAHSVRKLAVAKGGRG
jgi:hypothetical protein